MVLAERRLGRWLLLCCLVFLGALLLSIAAGVVYEPPSLRGNAGTSPWLEPDFLCSLGSGALALLVAGLAGRRLVRASVFSRLLLHSAVWFGLTAGVFLLWQQYLSLFTLLIAPTHAFAALRLGLLWRAWRTDVAWRAR